MIPSGPPTVDLPKNVADFGSTPRIAIDSIICDLVDGHMPLLGSGACFRPSAFVMPLLFMLNGGGQCLEDLRQIRHDMALRELLGWDRLP